MKRIRDFFWFCSGASFSLLKRCPTESSKYASIGGTVFFTGLLAAVSGGFALYSIFKVYWAAVVFGLLWGAMIFNLDRFLVSTLKKQEKPYREWLMAIPRVVLAILIAVVIAKPLELKVFSPEIASELSVITEEQRATRESVVNQRYAGEMQNANLAINVLENQIAQQQLLRDDLLRAAREEADGTGGSKQRNLGPIYALKKSDADNAQKELEELSLKNENLIGSLRSKLDSLSQAKGAELIAIDVSGIGGMALQLEALGRLSEKYSAIAFANIFIMLLFIIIEISPVLTKLMSPRGPYDDLLEAHEHGYVTFRKGKIHALDEQLERKLAWKS